eukprot:Opistho-2@32593
MSTPPTAASPPGGLRRRRGSSESHDSLMKADKDKDKEKPANPDEVRSSKWKNWWVRFTFTFLMIGGFAFIIYLGPFYLTLLVIGIQMMCFKEIIAIGHVLSKEKKLPWFRVLNWFFLLAANYYFYGESLIYYFQGLVNKEEILIKLAAHHRFISFCLYMSGFVLFVLSLKRGHYKFQFGQFAWTHITLLLIVTQSQFVITNIFEGIIWFLLPAAAVICNDIMAYVFGFFFGRTPLIKLSPKKTWEGFVGGLFSTVVFCFYFSRFLSQYEYFVCPTKYAYGRSHSPHCDIAYHFIPRDFNLPAAVQEILSVIGIHWSTINIAPIQMHSLAVAIFASLIAPFGGFFASGFKRAFQIKDFGDIIPGHGGITDRFDCQYLMATFAFVYHSTFIKTISIAPAALISAFTLLDVDRQIEVFETLKDLLQRKGVAV